MYAIRSYYVTLGMRLFSMLIIIPFLSVYALNLEGGAPWLTGYALGIFGLTQAVLQIPFGMLSDRIGYKKMMLAGLIMLIAGLLTAAYAANIYCVITSYSIHYTKLYDLSFQIKAGAWTGILGPNGSGKTTLLRALSGALPYAGEIEYNGQPLRSWSRKELARHLQDDCEASSLKCSILLPY